MLISSIYELNALLPANVSSESDRWLTLMEQTERNYIVQLLGNELYNLVKEEYMKIMNGGGMDATGAPLSGPEALVSTQSARDNLKYTPMQELIRLLQVPLVYMTLANNAGMLSVSLNDAGLNVATADSYDAAKKDDREALARDCYMNAHKGMEQVLLFLEEDARSNSPQFLEAWMKSRTFYRQNGLLLRTATEVDRLLDIAGSRETFLTLVPAILRFQENRIRPELGDRLTNAFIQFHTFGPQPKPADAPQPDGDEEPDAPQADEDADADDKAWQAVSSSMTYEDAFDEDLRPFLPYGQYSGMTAGERYKLRTWNKALLMIRSALAYYVEDATKKLRRATSLNDAMSAMERARLFISGNTSAFMGVIEESPFYNPPVNTPPETEDKEEKKDKPKPQPSSYICDPFETFYS